jgi:hypothetical protein
MAMLFSDNQSYFKLEKPMKFSESGLPADAKIEAAFNFSYANTKSLKSEMLQGFKEQVNGMFSENLQMLDAAKFQGQINENQYLQEKAQLENMLKAQLAMGPHVVDEELDNVFARNRLGAALELQQNSDSASSEAVAAALLVECVRSPVDYKRIEAKFGEGVAGLVAEILHIDAYPHNRADNLAAAGTDTKRVYLSMMVNSLNQISHQAQEMAQVGQKVELPPGQEVALFENIKSLRGNDKKLDQRAIESFNAVTTLLGSPFTAEVNTKGELTLVKNTVPSKRPLRGPIIGDDIEF